MATCRGCPHRLGCCDEQDADDEGKVPVVAGVEAVLTEGGDEAVEHLLPLDLPQRPDCSEAFADGRGVAG
jgi:hypothetical protein